MFLRLALAQPARFAVDFRVPAGAAGLEVIAGGKKQKLTPTAAGFLRLSRVWAPEETVLVRFDFPVRAHVHRDRDGKRWVAFTRGPLALAQDAPGQNADEAHAIAIPPGKVDAREVLQRVEAAGTVLVPYYQAGAHGGAVRTFFPLR